MSDRVDEAIDVTAKKLGFGKLKSHQISALRQFVGGHDLFVNLPTGFGKSVIFQAAPLVLDFLNEIEAAGAGKHEKALVIVVVPLKALAVDQLHRAKQLGLRSADITSDIPDHVLEQAEEFSILFSSPESLCSERGKELLKSVRSRCSGLFVDESHCVSKWGHSSGQSSAFRKCYGQIGELRSVLKAFTSVIALTATATRNVRKTVVASLALRNYFLIEESPERSNIKYVVVKSKVKNFQLAFSWIAQEVATKGILTDRIILYCQSRKHVSELYSMFCSLIPKDGHRFFNMYHTNTESDVQKQIIESFSHEDGDVRVLFATIAFGLGIDVQGVHTVVLVGHPTDLDDLMQLSGRAGRDGAQSVAVLFTYPGAGAGLKTSSDMKEFMTGDSCRREIIRRSFPSSGDCSTQVQKHNCCDICAALCTCDGDSCTVKPSFAEQQTVDTLLHGSCAGSSECQIAVVDEEMQSELLEQLKAYKHTLLLDSSSHLYTDENIACGLPDVTIQEVVNECHIVLDFDTFTNRYAILRRDVALAVWNLVKSCVYDQCVDFDFDFDRVSESFSLSDISDSEDAGAYAEAQVVYSSDTD